MFMGQRAMDSERATEIQQALIQAHYLSGSPTGLWDPETQAAMEKYQTDNGWQSKITPDSRALIKLGLGPKQDEGEYSSNPTGVSKLSPDVAAPVDAIRTMAISEMPAVTQN
jgi:peptidoglycan hydrolase-like protein with peptidoglycan-binding domain